MLTWRPLTRAEWQIAAGVAILIWCACSPVRPAPIDFSGDWFGTTSQNRPIAFTVSGDLRITSVTIDYSFAGCSGPAQVAANAALLNPNGTASAVVTYTPNGLSSSRIVMNFSFPSPTHATGTAQFIDFQTCGSSNVTWTADKR